MTRKSNKGMIVGLDIGTSKVVCMVGETTPEGGLEVVGLGTQPSRGIKKGVVVDIESTVQSIQRAIEEAELMAGCEIHSVYTGITGSHLRSFNSHGMVPIREREVSSADVARVIAAAKTLAIPADQQLLDVSVQEFVIDGQDGIRDPVGMCGVRLEVRVHIVTGAASAAQNIVKCVRRCGLEVDAIIPEHLASSRAVLSEDERELGVCLIDIGAGTTDLAVFTDGAIRHIAVIPIAGDQITNDIAVGLRTPTKHAEDIKIRYACTHSSLHGAALHPAGISHGAAPHPAGISHGAALHPASISHGAALHPASALNQQGGEPADIEVPDVGEQTTHPVPRKKLAHYIEPRLREILDFACDELNRSGLEDLVAAGVVLTGGTAKLEGATDLARALFPRPDSPDIPQIPVRLGLVQGCAGLEEHIAKDPAYATAVGLLLLGQEGHTGLLREGHEEPGMMAGWQRLRRWLQGNF